MKTPMKHYMVGTLDWQIEADGPIGPFGERTICTLLDGEKRVAAVRKDAKTGRLSAVIYTGAKGSGTIHFGAFGIESEEVAKLVARCAYKLWASQCFECGKCGWHENDWSWSNGQDLLARARCFSCARAEDWIAKAKKNDRMFVADGNLYTIGEPVRPGVPSHIYGFGGARFVIRFKDRSRPDVVTNNLWSQGPVNPLFRDELPDTAEFVKEPAP